MGRYSNIWIYRELFWNSARWKPSKETSTI